MGDLGQIAIVGPRFDVMDDSQIKRAVERSDVVINLIGAKFENWNWKFDHVNHRIAERIARCTKEVGAAQQFIQVSPIGADPASTSERLRTKALGDAAVRSHIPDATIVRAAPVVGEEDTFVNDFLSQARREAPTAPAASRPRGDLSPPLLQITARRVFMIDGGRRRVQPVWAKDVADGLVRLIDNPRLRGQTLYFGGPETYTEWDFVGRMQDEMRVFDRRIDIPKALAMLSVKPYQFVRNRFPLPIALHPVFGTVEDVEERTIDMVVPEGEAAPSAARGAGRAGGQAACLFSPVREEKKTRFAIAGAPGFQDLGLSPRNILESHVIDFIRFYRDGGYEFGERVGKISGSRHAAQAGPQ